jgi:hypothetical protein
MHALDASLAVFLSSDDMNALWKRKEFLGDMAGFLFSTVVIC